MTTHQVEVPMNVRYNVYVLAVLGCSVGCSASDGNSSVTGKGGSTSISSSVGGGGTATGGTGIAVGGSSSNSGGLTQGGASIGTGKGGGTATGGTASGGATTGGTNSSDGGAVSGGTATGGALVSKGGTASVGGAVSKGGTASVGGAVSKGGTANVGGAVSKGGTAGKGGAAAGGAPGTGGLSGSGGAVASGGSAGSPGCGATALPAACNTATTGPCTIDVGGLARQYFVVLPANYNANTAYPVVFAWHYLGGTAQGLLPTGTAYGPGAFYGVQKGFPNAIYVAGQGLDTGTAGTDFGWPNTNGQDVNFAKAMVAWVNANLCVDQSRIFATGMSYGGIMSNTVACQMPDVFRAIGVMSGSLGYGGRAPTCVNHPIAAWFTHGDLDKVVTIDGDITARDLFIKNNGCDTTNTEQVVLDANTTCTLYKVCSAGNYPVVWCPVVGEAHTIPSFAGTEISKFFTQF